NFSNETVLVNWSRVYAKSGTNIQSILDLEGKKIAVLRNSINVVGPGGIKELVKNFDINCSFIEVDSYNNVFELVKDNKADAGVTNNDFGNKHEKDFGLVKTPIIFQPSRLYFAFSKRSNLAPYLIKRIDYHMKELKENRASIYYQLLEKWLGEKTIVKPFIPGWIKWVLIGIFGLTFLLIVGNFVLRAQIRSKTKALKASEEKYRTLVDQSPDGIFIIDLEGNFLSVNKAICNTLGYDEKELIAMNIWDIVPEKYKKLYKKRVEKIFKGESLMVPAEYEVEAKDGRKYVVEIRSVPYIKEGKIVGLQGMVRDITERKRAEEEFQKMEKLESLGILAGGIAHDFNNLLTVILGNLSLSQTEANGELKEMLEDAIRASIQAKNLTQQLLTFSKGGEPIKEKASIEDIIRDSAKFVLRGSNVRCKYDFPSDLWNVEVDKGQFSQVINNLIINSDQAMPGGGNIYIKAENVILGKDNLLPLPTGKYIRIIVKDEGIGIPREHLKRIFDPYFTTKKKGSGLGLAIVYSIIKKHGGYITVESELGKGATFYIYLPAVERKTEKETEYREERAALTKEGKILFMDDDGMVRETVGRMLEKKGYKVETAENGEEAVKKYRKAFNSKKPFDAVILDLTVPGGMGGKEAMKKLKEIDPDVKAIVSSGYSTDPIMSHYKKYGFKGVVAKPFIIEELQEVLRRVLP
ncbi:PAS domain S-box protein, partial [candidate division WOR-3 bacterium]|nr:PAS domain S-box protein [candidate division WOR-3 bacterium]